MNECGFAHRLEGSADVASLLSPLNRHEVQMLKITRPPDSLVKGYQSVKNMLLLFRKLAYKNNGTRRAFGQLYKPSFKNEYVLLTQFKDTPRPSQPASERLGFGLHCYARVHLFINLNFNFKTLE